jgi:hypothetical protein
MKAWSAFCEKSTRLPILTGLSLLSSTSRQIVRTLTPSVALAAFAPTNS